MTSMTDEQKAKIEAKLRAAVTQIDNAERTWLSLTEDERWRMPASVRDFFLPTKQ